MEQIVQPPREKHSDDPVSPRRPPGLDAPKVLREFSLQLGRFYTLHPLSICLAAFTVLGSALGNRVRVRCGLWPSPLSGALQMLFLETAGAMGAMESLVQPLAVQQENLLRAASSTSEAQSLRETVNFIRAQEIRKSVDGWTDPERMAKLACAELRLKPFRLVRNPEAGRVSGAVAQSGDEALLVLYDSLGLGGLAEAGREKRHRDLMMWEHGWFGRMLAQNGLQDGYALTRPALSVLGICTRRQLQQLTRAGGATAGALLRVPLLPLTDAPTDSAGKRFPTATGDWYELVEHLCCVRESGRSDVIECEPEADRLLLRFQAECRSLALSEPDPRLIDAAPLVAAKLALVWEAALSPYPEKVSATAVQGAVLFAKQAMFHIDRCHA